MRQGRPVGRWHAAFRGHDPAAMVSWLLMRIAPWLLIVCLAGALGAAAVVSPISDIQADLRAANEARRAEADALSAWRQDQARLRAERDALRVELERLRQQRSAAEQATREADAARAALRLIEDPVAAASLTVAALLRRSAPQQLPGAVVVPASDDLTEVAKALDLTRRAATQVTVEIVAGHLAGTPDGEVQAVRLLRLGNLLAWWEALDGSAAGTAFQQDGTRLLLRPITDDGHIRAIRRAIAMAEGRLANDLVELPWMSP